MKHGTSSVLKVGCILLLIFLFGALVLLPQPVRAQTVTATVDVGNSPTGVTVTPNGEYAYIANGDSESVSLISTGAPVVSVSPFFWTMDVGQSTTFTAAASGGSGNYIGYQWYVNGVAQSGATALTFSYSPASTDSYSVTATVTDSLDLTSAQSTAATVTVNSALVAPIIWPSLGELERGQTSNLSSSSVTTGTSPYTYQWFESAPTTESYVTVGSNSDIFSFITSSSTAFGSWRFILQVTDNVGAAVNSSAAFVIINPTFPPTTAPTPTPTSSPSTVPTATQTVAPTPTITEFPTWIILPLSAVVMLLSAVFIRRRIPKKNFTFFV